MLAPVFDAKIKILTLTEKRCCLYDDQIEKGMHNACISSKFVQVESLHVTSSLQSARLIALYSKQLTIRKISMFV